MKIGVIVGHEKKAQGANLHRSVWQKIVKPFSGVSEYAYNTVVANLMFQHAQAIGVDLEIFFRDNIGISGAYNKARAAKCDCVIELHFNAYNGKAFGSETLCSGESVDRSFATVIQDAVCMVFGRGSRGNRGLSINPGRGGQSVTSYRGLANCLVEPFFGDNPEEAKMAIERQSTYAHALVDACVIWLNMKKAA